MFKWIGDNIDIFTFLILAVKFVAIIIVLLFVCSSIYYFWVELDLISFHAGKKWASIRTSFKRGMDKENESCP